MNLAIAGLPNKDDLAKYISGGRLSGGFILKEADITKPDSVYIIENAQDV
jgi:hypothetical protein